MTELWLPGHRPSASRHDFGWYLIPKSFICSYLQHLSPICFSWQGLCSGRSGFPSRYREAMSAQRTLRRPVSCTGIGLHSGNKVTLSLKPAPADYGLRFQRADLGGLEIPATVTHLGGIQYQT